MVRARSAQRLKAVEDVVLRMAPPDPVVILACPAGAERERLRREIGAGCQLEVCDGPGDVPGRMARGDVGAVVVRVDAPGAHRATAALEGLRRRFPTLPIIGYMPPGEPRGAARLVTLRRTVSGLIVAEQSAALGEIVVKALKTAPPQGPYWPLLAAVEGRVDDDIYAFMKLCILNPGPTAMLGQLYDAYGEIYGVARRTLEEKLAKRDCRRPAKILTACTVAVGMWFHDRGRMALDGAAAELHLSSGARLSTMCRSRFGLGPREIKALGGFRYVLPLCSWHVRVLPPREILAW